MSCALSPDPLARFISDYAYWAETCYRIRDKFGHLVPLRLRPIQARCGEIERTQLDTTGRCRGFVLKGRQGGISTDQQARNLHQICTDPGFDAMTLAHVREDTDKLFAITLRAVANFPPDLRPPFGPKETREISIPEMDAVFWTGTAGAKRTGRGLTLKRVHGSEFAFWDAPRETLGAITPALVPVGSVVWLETTASGYGSVGHEFWRDAESGQSGYVTVFVPWWECDPENYRLPLLAPDELDTLEPDEQSLVSHHGLSLEEIKWRRRMVAEIGKSEFLREYPEDSESCWLTAGGLYYDAETLKRLLTVAPQAREHRGDVAIYADCPAGERVIMGVDTAEGTTDPSGKRNDRSAWTARSFPSWTLLAQFESRIVVPDAFAANLDEWGRQYNALIVVEKNMHGITVLRRLRDHHKYPVSRIYHRQPPDRPEVETLDRIGWATTAESKPLMLNAGHQLLEAASHGRAGLLSQATVRDAFGVLRDEKGSANLNGKDVLVSEMLAWLGRSQPQATIGSWFVEV